MQWCISVRTKDGSLAGSMRLKCLTSDLSVVWHSLYIFSWRFTNFNHSCAVLFRPDYASGIYADACSSTNDVGMIQHRYLFCCKKKTSFLWWYQSSHGYFATRFAHWVKGLKSCDRKRPWLLIRIESERDNKFLRWHSEKKHIKILAILLRLKMSPHSSFLLIVVLLKRP